MVRFNDDPQCEFLAYLESRLGKDEAATVRVLGEWLAKYEPESHRQLAPRRLTTSRRDPHAT